MADQKPAADAATAQRPGPVAIQIAAQYVKDLSFENPNAPQSVQPGAAAPQVAVNVDVRTQQLADKTYEVVLHIKGDAKSGDKQAFIIELSYGGVIMLGEVPKEHVAPLLLIEAPRLLFPFLRRLVADLTREGGFPPLFLDPIDFGALYVNRRRREEGEPPGGGNIMN